MPGNSPEASNVIYEITKNTALTSGQLATTMDEICRQASGSLGVAANDQATFCLNFFENFTSAVIQSAAPRISGPTVLVGICIPILIAGIVICFCRLFRIFNIRSVALLFSTLGASLLIGSSLYACLSFIGDFKTTDLIGVIGLSVALTFLLMASVVRFSQVINAPGRRKLFEVSMILLSLILGAIQIGLGFYIIENSATSPTIFPEWYISLSFLPILIYMICGLFGFSWKLPRKADNPGMKLLRTLRVVNDILMALAILVAIGYAISFFLLRKFYYGASLASLAVTLLITIENIFESVINAVRGESLFHERNLDEQDDIDHSNDDYSYRDRNYYDNRNQYNDRNPYYGNDDYYGQNNNYYEKNDNYYGQNDDQNGLSYYDKSVM